MRRNVLKTMGAVAAMTIGSLAAPAAAMATTPATVSGPDCYAAGGYYGGYNAEGRAFCTRGTYDGVLLDKDPMQMGCPEGQHIAFRYLMPPICVSNITNRPV